jgi:hypothetical protein
MCIIDAILHYRCNLAGYDLNRHWHDPDRNVHPTIVHAKDLLITAPSLG